MPEEPSSESAFDLLQNILEHKFRNIFLLTRAFISKACSSEDKFPVHREPLAVLGDPIISSIVVEYVIKELKYTEKGEISRFRDK